MPLFLSTKTPLHRLIYYSRSNVPSTPQSSTLVRDIVEVAARRNTAVGVTGALLLCRGWFLQALEGRPDAVKEIYTRIRADRRHTHVTIIADDRVRAREFGGWSMCGRELSATDEAIVDSLEASAKFDVSTLTAHSALRLLSKVRDQQMRNRSPLSV